MSRRKARQATPRVTASKGSKRRRLAITIALAAAMALVALAVLLRDPWSGPPRHPNVLLITIDTLRWDHLGSYGAAFAATPVLDGLAARGTRFETAVMHVPLTAPSHASMLTGLTPPRHGIRDNGAFVLSPDLESLPAGLKRAGYETGGFISGFPLDRRFGFAAHFDTFDDRLPRDAGAGSAAHTERRADLTTDAVLEWLRGRATERPWLAWVHYFDPHAPYEPPADLRQQFASRPYDGEVAFVDREIGRLLRRVDEQRLLGNTIVLVTADHGESLGEHREETHGVFVYDATVRVPWIMSGPGVAKGLVTSIVARGVDVMPTLLQLAGVPIPVGSDGRSLVPGLRGDTMPDEPAYLESQMAMRHLGWSAVYAMRDAHWKLIQAPRPELYDLSADPQERQNRFEGNSAGPVARLERALQSRLAAKPAIEARPPDRETSDRLRSLGYLGSGTSRPVAESTKDPKDGIELINRLERAVAAIRVDPRQAAEELRRVLGEDARIELARRQLAVALAAAGDHAAAAEEIRTLQASHTATAEDLLVLAESQRVLGRPDAATRTIEEASRLDSRSPEVALTRGRLLMAERRPQDAALAYEDALRLSPDNPEALTGLGNIALATGDSVGASRYFERVLARDPRDPAARAGLGLVRGREGRMAEAIALLEPVVRESPDHAEALAGLGAALARTGRPAAAVPYFQRAVTAGLRTPPVLNGLGFARLEAGDRSGALEALKSSLALQPDQPRVQEAVRQLAGAEVRREVR
jgi:arylsulfatase A-like enzyme/Flp pilus assembly protein TadD